MGKTKTKKVEWSHATETVVLQLDNTEEWQRWCFRTCRQYGANDGSIHIEEWFCEEVFPEGGDGFEEAARTIFLEGVDWVEVAFHFARKSFEAYLMSTDEESADLVDEAAASKFGDRLIETFYEHDQWFAKVWTEEDGDEEQTYNVVDAVPGLMYGLDFELI